MGETTPMPVTATPETIAGSRFFPILDKLGQDRVFSDAIMRPMQRSTREVEVKLEFDSPSLARAEIERLGANLVQARQIEDNVLFDREHSPLKPAGKMLRIRRSGSTALLTYKAPVEGQRPYKVRAEHETRVEDPEALTTILLGLGFSRSYRYQKYRTVFQDGSLDICLDETPLGCFVELEGPPEEIDRVATRLGFSPARYVRESYRELHERRTRERGFPMGDLLVEPEPGAPA